MLNIRREVLKMGRSGKARTALEWLRWKFKHAESAESFRVPALFQDLYDADEAPSFEDAIQRVADRFGVPNEGRYAESIRYFVYDYALFSTIGGGTDYLASVRA